MKRALAMLLLLAAACGGPGKTTWTRVDPAELTPAQRKLLGRAEQAKKSLGIGLANKLQAALATGSPADAIRVCRDDAPGIAEGVERRMELRIGRTSHRLRNPENRPPAWAAALVASVEDDPGAVAEPAVFRGADGRIGAVFPIPTKSFCLTCHGPPGNVTEDVRAKLAELYPADRATGFDVGEPRGVFWVEVMPRE